MRSPPIPGLLAAALVIGVGMAAGPADATRERDIWREFTVDYDSRMISNEYRALRYRSPWRCAQACSRETRCQAFSYNRASGSCRLLSKPSRQRDDRWFLSGVKIQQHPHAGAVRVGRVELEFGSERSGSGYRSVYLDQAQECAGYCDRDTRCDAMRYEADNRRCTLLAAATAARPRPDIISGLKQRSTERRSEDPDTGFLIRRNTAFFGNDYRNSQQETRSACLKQCADDPGCTAFTWQPFTGECFLKAQPTPAKYRKGFVSGVRQDAAQRATLNEE